MARMYSTENAEDRPNRISGLALTPRVDWAQGPISRTVSGPVTGSTTSS